MTLTATKGALLLHWSQRGPLAGDPAEDAARWGMKGTMHARETERGMGEREGERERR